MKTSDAVIARFVDDTNWHVVLFNVSRFWPKSALRELARGIHPDAATISDQVARAIAEAVALPYRVEPLTEGEYYDAKDSDPLWLAAHPWGEALPLVCTDCGTPTTPDERRCYKCHLSFSHGKAVVIMA